MSNAFGWCFIGAGSLAKQVAREITKSGKHVIVSVYTRRYEKGKEFAAKFGGKAYATAKEAILAEGVQGVYVVTPHNSHYEYTKLALALGKPVLCEKPFATDAEKTEELFTLAREKGVYAAEAMWTWFSPVAHKVKQWLDDGEFGEIQKITANYRLNMYRFSPRLTDPALAGGALLDIGVYPVTYLYRLFGKPTEVRCKGVVENGVDMEEDIFLTFENGQTFPASVSMRDFKGIEKLEIVGSKARLRLILFHCSKRVKLIRKDGHSEVFSGDGSYLNEFNLVSDEILSGKTESAYVPPKTTVEVMQILDECRRQMGLRYPFEK